MRCARTWCRSCVMGEKSDKAAYCCSSCTRHTHRRQRQVGHQSAPRAYLSSEEVRRGRVPLESAEVVGSGRGHTTTVTLSTPAQLLRRIWHEVNRAGSTNKKITNRTGFRDQYTQKGILLYHGWQSSAQGPIDGATRGGGKYYHRCASLHCALSAAGRCRQSRLVPPSSISRDYFLPGLLDQPRPAVIMGSGRRWPTVRCGRCPFRLYQIPGIT